jgi:hypothetical protein
MMKALSQNKERSAPTPICRIKMGFLKLYGRPDSELPYKNGNVYCVRQFQGDFPYEMRKLKSIRQLGKKVAV